MSENQLENTNEVSNKVVVGINIKQKPKEIDNNLKQSYEDKESLSNYSKTPTQSQNFEPISQSPENVFHNLFTFPSSLPTHMEKGSQNKAFGSFQLRNDSNYTVAANADDAYKGFSERHSSNYDPNHSVRYSSIFGHRQIKDDLENHLIDNDSFKTNSYGSFKESSGFDAIMPDGSKQKRTISLNLNNENISNSLNTPSKLNFKKLDPINENTLRTAEESSLKEMPTWRHFNIPELTLLQKKVIKSVLSYFIGSLLTFIPFFRAAIGTSSHMAAISCFFLNPGQSLGQFIESMTYGILFVLFGLAVSYASLANMAFWNSKELPRVGDVSTWIVFLGGASFFLAYIKAKYPKPTVLKCIPNAFIFIYIVLVNYTPFVGKDLDPFKIYDLAKTLSSGILINFIICTQLWPRWEADKLRDDIIQALESTKKNLSTIVQTFLLEEVKGFSPSQIDDLMAKHRSYFLTLKQRYTNSYWEFQLEKDKYFVLGKVMDRLNRLGQKLGGLSSGVDAQKEILECNGINIHNNYIKIIKANSKVQRRFSKVVSPSSTGSTNNTKGSNIELGAELEIFSSFLKLIGPPTKSLTFTCKQTIAHLIYIVKKMNRTAHLPTIYHWNENPNESGESILDSKLTPQQLKANLNSALELFSEAQSQAIVDLYKRTSYDGKPTEEVFLVYFFVFALEEFVKELTLMIDSIEELANFPVSQNYGWFYLFRTQVVALFAICWQFSTSSVQKMTSVVLSKDGAINSNSVEPLHNPSTQTFYQRYRANLWYFLMGLRDYRILFSIKSSLAVLLVSAPIYLFGLKEMGKHFRLGWTLITISLVMSPTIGASNIYGIYRFSGTAVGSLIAYAVYSIFSHNVVALTISSTLTAIPCMYLFLASSVPKFGQFIMLSYNLIVLTTYANRHDVEFSFEEYSFIRATSVTLGVFIGLLFGIFLLPLEARKELRLGLSNFFLDLSKLYIKLVNIYSNSNTNSPTELKQGIEMELPLNLSQNLTLLNEDPEYLKDLSEFLDMELRLQRQLLELIALLPNTVHEPRLKGPFPTSTYKKMLNSSQVVLDKLVAIRIAITKPAWRQRVRQDFVIPLNAQRRELAGTLILLFHILASTLVLKTPMPPYLPPAHQARTKLVEALRELPIVRRRTLFQEDRHHIVYYAFVVVLDDLIDELDTISDCLKELFGVISCEPLEGISTI